MSFSHNLLKGASIICCSLAIAWGTNVSEAQLMEPALLQSPSGLFVTDLPSTIEISWNNQAIQLIDAQTDPITGDKYVALNLSLQDEAPITCNAYLMHLDAFGSQPAEWYLDVALYEIPDIKNFSGNKFSLNIPEGVVKNNSDLKNPAQAFNFEILPVYTDYTFTPEYGTSMKQEEALVKIKFDDPIKYLQSNVVLNSYQPSFNKYLLKIGEDVTISNNNEIVINLTSFRPGEYEIVVPAGLVEVEANSQKYLSQELWLEYTIVGSSLPDNPGTGQTVITSAEGTEKFYDKDSVGTAFFAGAVKQYKDQFPASIVWGDNNVVYIKDIISTFNTGNFVKGTIYGNTITVPLNQLVDYYEEEGYGIKLAVFKSVENPNNPDLIDFYYEPSITEVSYTLDSNGDMSLNLPGDPFDGKNVPEYVLGLCYSDSDEFIGFSDYAQEYTLLDIVQTQFPKDAESEYYVFIDSYNYANLVEIATQDGKMYIKGLCDSFEEGVIVGSINGNEVVFEQNQYLGIYYDSFYIYTKVAVPNPDYDEEDYLSSPFILAPADAVFKLIIDYDNNIITTADKDVYLSFQPDEDDCFNSIGLYGDFLLRYQSTSAGTPANPTKLVYTTEYMPYQGFNDFMFTLSNFSTEGNLLDTETLYYRIFIDDEPLIFGEEIAYDLLDREVIIYEYVPDQQIYMVYEFQNGNDISKFTYNEFDIGIYMEGVSTVGVQSMYRHEGVVTYSDLVTLDVETGQVTETGVKTVKAESPVVKREFYTLSGMKVEHPSKGMYAVREIHADGTVTSAKLLMK